MIKAAKIVLAVLIAAGPMAEVVNGRAADCYWFSHGNPLQAGCDLTIRVVYKSGHSIVVHQGDSLPFGCNVQRYEYVADLDWPACNSRYTRVECPGCVTQAGGMVGCRTEGQMGVAVQTTADKKGEQVRFMRGGNPWSIGCGGCTTCEAEDEGKPDPEEHPEPGGDGFPQGIGWVPEEPDGIRNECDPDEVNCQDVNDNGICDECDEPNGDGGAVADLSEACNPATSTCDDDDDGICTHTSAGIPCPPAEPECVSGTSHNFGECSYMPPGSCAMCCAEYAANWSWPPKVDEIYSAGTMPGLSQSGIWASMWGLPTDLGFSGTMSAIESLCEDEDDDGVCDNCPEGGDSEPEPEPEPLECDPEETCCLDDDEDGYCDWCTSSDNCGGDEDEDGVCNECDKDYMSAGCDDENEDLICDHCQECEDDCPNCPCADRLDRIIELLEGDGEETGPEPEWGTQPPTDLQMAAPTWTLPDFDEASPGEWVASVPLPGGQTFSWDIGSMSLVESLPEVATPVGALLTILRACLVGLFSWRFVVAIFELVGGL